MYSHAYFTVLLYATAHVRVLRAIGPDVHSVLPLTTASTRFATAIVGVACNNVLPTNYRDASGTVRSVFRTKYGALRCTT